MSLKIVKHYKKIIKKPYLILSLLFALLAIIDLTNIDSFVYKQLCLSLHTVGSQALCPDYYDLPFWDLCVAVGTITAAIFAYGAIRESNRRLEIEQSPHVVLTKGIKLEIFSAEPGNRVYLHSISLKNIGRGRASNITATADQSGTNSIIDGTNPHSIDLNTNEHYPEWSIDENRVIEGLVEQDIVIANLYKDMPDETTLRDTQKEKADFCLFLWYEDQLANKYRTKTVIRRSGSNFKVMRNEITKL